MDATLTAAAAAGARLLVLPELYPPGYNRPDLHHSLAQGMTTRSAPDGPSAPVGPRLPYAGSFWVVALAFLLLMSFTTVPTPLAPLYQHADRFASFMIR